MAHLPGKHILAAVPVREGPLLKAGKASLNLWARLASCKAHGGRS